MDLPLVIDSRPWDDDDDDDDGYDDTVMRSYFSAPAANPFSAARKYHRPWYFKRVIPRHTWSFISFIPNSRAMRIG